jgi:formylmethanofuran dehydrogenase subunit E
MSGEEGVHGKCDSCGNPIYEHMTENKAIFDDTGLCGVCATGESAVYFDEL